MLMGCASQECPEVADVEASLLEAGFPEPALDEVALEASYARFRSQLQVLGESRRPSEMYRCRARTAYCRRRDPHMKWAQDFSRCASTPLVERGEDGHDSSYACSMFPGSVDASAEIKQSTHIGPVRCCRSCNAIALDRDTRDNRRIVTCKAAVTFVGLGCLKVE